MSISRKKKNADFPWTSGLYPGKPKVDVAADGVETSKQWMIEDAAKLGYDWTPYTPDEVLIKMFIGAEPAIGMGPAVESDLMKLGLTLWDGSLAESASRGIEPELAAFEGGFVVRAYASYISMTRGMWFGGMVTGGAEYGMSREGNQGVKEILTALRFNANKDLSIFE